MLFLRSKYNIFTLFYIGCECVCAEKRKKRTHITSASKRASKKYISKWKSKRGSFKWWCHSVYLNHWCIFVYLLLYFRVYADLCGLHFGFLLHPFFNSFAIPHFHFLSNNAAKLLNSRKLRARRFSKKKAWTLCFVVVVIPNDRTQWP